MPARVPRIDDFEVLPRRVAEAVSQEFVARIPDLIHSLELRVQGSGVPSWHANFRDSSLVSLTRWLLPKLESRWKSGMPDELVGVFAEIGAYMGEMLRRSSPLLSWACHGDPRDANYNTPYVKLDPNYGFAAIQFCRNWGYRWMEGERLSPTLLDLYKRWDQKLPALHSKCLAEAARARRAFKGKASAGKKSRPRARR